MFGLLWFVISLGAAWVGYGGARRFVRERLRYVDGALAGGAPFVAGIGAFLVAFPVVWLLPLVTTGTAIAFGFGVGLGSKAGASDVKNGYRLNP